LNRNGAKRSSILVDNFDSVSKDSFESRERIFNKYKAKKGFGCLSPIFDIEIKRRKKLGLNA